MKSFPSAKEKPEFDTHNLPAARVFLLSYNRSWFRTSSQDEPEETAFFLKLPSE